MRYGARVKINFDREANKDNSGNVLINLRYVTSGANNDSTNNIRGRVNNVLVNNHNIRTLDGRVVGLLVVLVMVVMVVVVTVIVAIIDIAYRIRCNHDRGADEIKGKAVAGVSEIRAIIELSRKKRLIEAIHSKVITTDINIAGFQLKISVNETFRADISIVV